MKNGRKIHVSIKHRQTTSADAHIAHIAFVVLYFVFVAVVIIFLIFPLNWAIISPLPTVSSSYYPLDNAANRAQLSGEYYLCAISGKVMTTIFMYSLF